jgi:hypothetical protein
VRDDREVADVVERGHAGVQIECPRAGVIW